MEQEQQQPDAAPIGTMTTADAPAGESAESTAGADDRPESLAQALGEDGPGIAAEIESELSDGAIAPAAEETPPAIDPAELGDRLGILAGVQVTLTARLCATSQPLGAVLSMKPGTIVDLGRETNGPIELLANGVVVAYGEVVAVGSSLGVRVTSLPPS